MKLLSFIITALLWSSYGFSQGLSSQSMESILGNHFTETPLIQKMHRIESYNLKIKQELKNGSKVQKQALDSLYLMLIDTNNSSNYHQKYTFAYDGLGRQTRVTIYFKDYSINLWNKSKKETFNYDASGDLITDIIFEWNNVLNKWLESWKWEFTYNSSGLITHAIHSKWNNGSVIWENYNRGDYTYDASSELIQINYYLWDKAASQWFADGKRVYNYVAGKMVQWIVYARNGQNQINPNIKVTFDYYANDSLKSAISQLFYPDSNVWIYMGKIINIYDANNDNTYNLEYKYNYNQNSWDTLHKTVKTFFANHHISSSIYSTKDTLNNQWNLQSKRVYTEDYQGIITDISSYYWKAVYGVWVPEFRSGFYLDNSVAYSDLILPMEYEGDCIKGKIDYAKQYNYDPWTISWHYIKRYQYFFTFHTVGLAARFKTHERIVITPNPSSGKFRISLPEALRQVEVNVVNIAGQEVYHRKIQNSKSIDIELNTSQGLYFITLIKPDGNREVFKMVVR